MPYVFSFSKPISNTGKGWKLLLEKQNNKGKPNNKLCPNRCSIERFNLLLNGNIFLETCVASRTLERTIQLFFYNRFKLNEFKLKMSNLEIKLR